MRHTRSSPAPGSACLERFRNEAARCVRCGSCKAVCPSFAATLDESFSARGRMALVQSLLEGKIGASSVYRDRLSSCTGCLACEAACPSGVPVTWIVQAAREAAVQERGVGMIRRIVGASLAKAGLMSALAWLAPVVLHYAGTSVKGRPGAGAPRSGKTPGTGDRGQGPVARVPGTGSRGTGQKSTRGRVAFFPGCAITHFQQDIGRATENVLSALGYEMIVPDGLQCCGRPHLSLGDRAAAEALACRNTDALAALEVEAVVVACASCGLTFKNEYPALLAPSGRTPVPVLDIHELLARSGRVPGLAALRLRTTWHDPCHLGRGQGLSRTARSVLLEVPGIELVEMEEPDQCCGFGGVMRITQRGLSDRVGRTKAEAIIATGARTVVTGCPGCRMQISEALRRAGSDIVVVHTVQVIEKALGVRREESGEREAEPAAAGLRRAQ